MDGLQAVAGTANAERAADLVFVHGLGGDSRSTWMNKGEASFWPQWLAEDFPSLGVWALGYAADVSAWQSESMPLSDRGQSVLELLVSNGLGKRPLIFVAHSLGGIVVKQVLNAAYNQGVPRWKQIGKATRGIAFIATPHSGANIANFVSFVGSMLSLNEPVEDLHAHHPHLRDLHGWFLNTFLKEQSVVCRTYCERREVRPGMFGLKLPKGMIVVDATSAEPNIPGERAIPLDEDHFSICKPLDRGVPLCLSLWAFVRECLAPPPAVSPTGVPGSVSQDGAVLAGGARGAGSETIGTALGASEWQAGVQVAQTLAWGASDPVATGLSSFLAGSGSPASLLRLAKPKPRLEELFEIVTDPDEVPKALFRAESGRGWVPYEVKFVQGRVGIADVQQALSDALLDSGGRLLLAGRGGIGKTRETAELATDMCLRGWVIAVARPDADVRLGPLAAIPGMLHDARLLLIVDNLHARAGADDEAPSYPERLTQCIDSLSRQGLDELRVMAITRDEPRFERSLGLDAGADRWREFAVFRLPDLTAEGLSNILAGLVARAQLTLDAAVGAKLVASSDRTPRTLFINVDLSRRRGHPLDAQHWLPTEGESWREKSRAVLARHPESAGVMATLRLLTAVGLPPRFGYVMAVGDSAGVAARRSAIEALIDEGLVGRRRGELTLFDSGPVASEGSGAAAQPSNEKWEAVIAAFMAPSAQPPEWLDDLALLALALLRGERPESAVEVATVAIDRGADGALVYKARGGAHFLSNARQEALRDLDAAIARDPQDAASWFLRGLLNFMVGNADGVLTDMARALELGHEAGVMHAQCGLIHQQRKEWREAETAFARAIELDGADADGMLFFLRGTARQQLGELTAAAADLDTAIERPSNMQAAMKMLPALQPQGVGGLFDALRNEVPRGLDHAAMVYPARAFLRLKLGRFAEAEQDFDAAIRLDFAGTIETVSRALEMTPIPVLVQAVGALREMTAQLSGDALLYAGRGVARRALRRWGEALSDFETALTRGAKRTAVLLERAQLYLACDRFAEAEDDSKAALVDPDAAALAYSLRAAARLGLKRMVEAEADLDEAIRLGRDDALVYVWRAELRAQRANFVAAAEDLDKAVARPDSPSGAWLMRGRIRLELGQAVPAEQDAEEAIARGADAAAAVALRGAARLTSGRLTEAEVDLSDAIARGRDDFFVYRCRGIGRAGLGHPDALTDLDNAVARGDSAGVTFYYRGLVRLRAGEPSLAKGDLDRALAEGFAPMLVHALRGAALLRLGQHADARTDFDAAIEGGNVDAPILAGRAEARQALGDLAGAAGDLQRAFELAPEDPELLGTLTDALSDLRRYADAARVLDAVLERNQERLDARLRRANLYLLAGRFEDAESDYDSVIEQSPDEPSLRSQRSVVRYGRGNAAGAIADLDMVVAQALTDAQPLADRAEAYLLLGDLDKAERDIRAMAALAPAAATSHGTPAMLALARGDFDKARIGFEQAASADPSGNWMCRVGLACLLGGRVEDALAAYAQGTAGVIPGNAGVALLELDHWLTGKAVDAAAVSAVRAQLSAALRSGTTDPAPATA